MKKYLSIPLILFALLGPGFASGSNPLVPKVQLFDDNGTPLAGGQVFTYEAGTSTLQASYTDSSLGTPNANPVILDAAGRASIWLDSSKSYKIVVKDADDVTVWTADNITGLFATDPLTLGTGAASDIRIQFDGNAQDYYLALQDLTDDLIIGLGSTVGTTGILFFDENQDLGVGSASVGGRKLYVAGNQMVDGQADEVQLLLQGHSTQTNNVFLVENSAGTDLFSLSNAGNGSFAGTLSVTGASTLTGAVTIGAGLTVGTDLTVADELIVSGVGPHAIGGAVFDRYQLYLRGSFTGSTSVVGLRIDSNLTPTGPDVAYGLQVNPTLNKVASGTHSEFIGSLFSIPTIGGGAATLTNAATVKIAGAPIEATNNYALWVDGGTSRFDDELKGTHFDASTGYISAADGSNGFQIRNLGAGVTGIKFSNYSNNTEWMRINSSGSVGINKSSGIGAQLHIVSDSSALPAAIFDTAASPTEPALEVRHNGSNGIIVFVNGDRHRALNLPGFDNGTAAGPRLEIGVNQNTTTPAPGYLVLFQADLAATRIWPDNSGDIRTSDSVDPNNANLTAGTVVGDQTSIAANRIAVSNGSVTKGDANFTWTSTGGLSTISTSSSATPAFDTGVAITGNRSGTMGTDDGIGISFSMEDSGSSDATAGLIGFSWDDNTAGSQDSRFQVVPALAGVAAIPSHELYGRGWMVMNEADSNPTSTQLDDADSLAFYTKGNTLVFAYNNGGSITFITLSLDGSDTTWSHSTTAP